MKLKALEMTQGSAFGSHIGGGFSAMEIMASIYAVAQIPSMEDPGRDRVIVSKGHCTLAYFTALWKKGFLSEEDLACFEADGSSYYAHAFRNLAKGIEFSGGSLGLGVSFAAGVARACKEKNLENRVFVVVGDGELNEGMVWEALMSAGEMKLDNLTVIVDRNGYQVDGPTEEVMDLSPLEKKFEAFGFEACTIDGHSLGELVDALSKRSSSPRAIIAKTIKAHGISFLENNKMSHHCVLSKKKYEQAVQEIKAAYGAE
ncbi:MAG: transketolase [Bacteroidales bacterium]|nr:transketolase [Bacteroidales bacterium]